jgi:hypothetical protein
MSDWQLIEFEPDVGRSVFARRIDDKDRHGWEIKTEYYADPSIEANKTALNNASAGWAGDYHRIASLSPGIAYGDGYIAQALKAGDDKSVSKWLNDSDNKAWRTKEGRV